MTDVPVCGVMSCHTQGVRAMTVLGTNGIAQKLRMLQPNNIRIEFKIPVRIFVGEKESEYHRRLYMLRVWQKPKAGPNYLVTHFATELEF